MASGFSKRRDTAARYATRLFVSSPTTPHFSKSSSTRSSRRGSRSRSSAAASSSAVITAFSSAGVQHLAQHLALQVGEHRPQLTYLAMDRLFLRRQLVRGLLDERRAPQRSSPCPTCRRDSSTRRARSAPDTFTLTCILPRAGAFLEIQHAVRARPDGDRDLAHRRSPPPARLAQPAASGAARFLPAARVLRLLHRFGTGG